MILKCIVLLGTEYTDATHNHIRFVLSCLEMRLHANAMRAMNE